LPSQWYLEKYNIDRNSITISGISSGGAMAVQMHVAHSKLFSGMAAIAAPPYWCANANSAIAITSCMMYPQFISVVELWAATTYAYSTFSIDNPSNLDRSKVWLFAGKLDSVVDPGVVEKTLAYYKGYIPTANIVHINNITAEHAWITDIYGKPCTYLGYPYINNCGFDAAGSLLQHLYGQLKPRIFVNATRNILEFSQGLYTPAGVTPAVISLDDSGFLYVPTACRSSTTRCKLHVFLHGCNMEVAEEGDVFYLHTGLNEWAESNNIIVLYPQTIATITNPQACWDWWGYTGLNYATKWAFQVITVTNMIRQLAGLN